MIRQQVQSLGKAAFIGAILLLAACGRSYTAAPNGLNQDPYGGGNIPPTGTIPTPPIVTNPNPTNPDPTTPTNPTYACTITLVGGSAVATQAPQTPVPVQYLMAVTPATTATIQPQVLSLPSNAFTVSSMVPNNSSVTITGNFSVAGSVKVQASANISGQIVNCEAVTTVTVAATPTVVVNRFDRSSPPDIFYATSSSAPAGYAGTGAMFKVFTQAPPTSKCNSVPLNQCILPRAPSSTTFLTQAANCGGYPIVAQIGFTCASNVSGTTPLYRVTNNIDHRYYTTASSQDVQILTSQGWIYEGIIGYAPLQ